MSLRRIAALFLIAAACMPTSAFAQGSAPQILDRQPTEWKQAAQGTWKGWSHDQVPSDELMPYFQRAVGAYKMGDLPASLQALFELLEVSPDYPSALHQSGVIYFRLRRYGDAIVAFERYLTVAPANVGDTRALGHCYYTLGDYDGARAHYEKVLAIDPESVEAIRGYALAWMRTGEAERALKELNRLMELDPSHANAATWIAQILFDEERVEEARESGVLARDLDPYQPRPWFLLSQIYFDLEQDEEAEAAQARFRVLSQIDQEVRAAEARLLYNPRQPDVYARLVGLNRQAGNLMAVGRWLNRWREQEPGRISIPIEQLNLAVEVGDPALAAKMAENLSAVAGDNLVAWERLAQFYAKNRDRIRQSDADAQIGRLRAKQPR
ncbi:MAG: putative Zn-dependent protease [Planctomycetota bacterium]|jgi:predicted Zn-dependent protease